MINSIISCTENKICTLLKITKSNISHSCKPQWIKIIKDSFTATNTVTFLCLATHAFTVITGRNLITSGSLNMSKVLKGQVWRIVTHIFLHGDIFHLMSNVLSLRSIGPSVERKWGASGFVKIATLSVAVDLLAKVILKSTNSSVGFSGVLFGMAGAFHMIKTPHKGIQINIKSLFETLVLGSVFGIILEQNSGIRIDHVGHVSGYLAGLTFGVFI